MTNPEAAIRVENLKFGYDGAEVLHGISFDIYRHHVTGLLGPNGAGKSTTLKILTGILQLREGRVAVEGFELPQQAIQVKKHLGYVPESADLYESLSALEFLELCGRFHEIEEPTLQRRIDVLLENFGLSGQRRNRLGSYSKGMRQKVLLSAALLHDPDVLILDEVAVLIIGKRSGYGKIATPPHNLPFAVIGASMLWVGWFGFNAGSALGANGLATSAFVVTHTAASLAALGWMVAEWFKTGKPTMLGAASGAVAGLVAITPASGFVSPLSAIVIGFAAGIICYTAVMMKSMFGYDDSLDVVGVHGVGGIFGAIATGIFASRAINPAGNDGAIYGNWGLVGTQLVAVGATIVFAVVGTTVILLVLKAVMGLRVTEQEERLGLDLSQHNESAYVFTPDYDEGASVPSHGSPIARTVKA